jgi:hypothetical protein
MYPIVPDDAPNAAESIACPTANVPVGVFVTVKTTDVTDAVSGYVPFTPVTLVPETENADDVVVMRALLNVPESVYVAEPLPGTVAVTGNERPVDDDGRTVATAPLRFANENPVFVVVTDAPFESPWGTAVVIYAVVGFTAV